MQNPEAAPRAPHDLSFETGSKDTHDDVQISAREEALNKEHTMTSAKAAAAVHDEEPVDFESCHIEEPCTNDEDVITREVQSAVKEMVTK